VAIRRRLQKKENTLVNEGMKSTTYHTEKINIAIEGLPTQRRRDGRRRLRNRDELNVYLYFRIKRSRN
jgi:hypothetical protein